MKYLWLTEGRSKQGVGALMLKVHFREWLGIVMQRTVRHLQVINMPSQRGCMATVLTYLMVAL